MKFLDPWMTVSALLWLGLTAATQESPMKYPPQAVHGESKRSASASMQGPALVPSKYLKFSQATHQ